MEVDFCYVNHVIDNPVQLRDPKNDFIFNFNFDDELKNL